MTTRGIPGFAASRPHGDTDTLRPSRTPSRGLTAVGGICRKAMATPDALADYQRICTTVMGESIGGLGARAGALKSSFDGPSGSTHPVAFALLIPY